MDIITGHVNSDFDCLASMIAANKLYPHAVMVLPGIIGKDVRKFLNLYRDSFNFISVKDIDIDQIERIIVVDTNSKSRLEKPLGKLFDKPDVDILVYDHHPLSENMIETQKTFIKDVGACVTLLVDEIQKLGIEVSPLEATVLALGIYADTNCLTLPKTSSMDANALAFLLSKGANLQVIDDYMTNPLSLSQQVLLEKMGKNIKVIDINGFKVAFSAAEAEEYVDNAAFLTRKLLEERDYDAFFSILRMEGKTYIIGRSLEDEIDVGQAMTFFNGGGHTGAGSGKSDEADLDKVLSSIEKILRENIRPVERAKDIMSSPVKTISLDSSIDEAGKIMLRYGHSGLPVVKDGILCGIISRRDVEKARLHGFGNSPVKAYMTKNVITINPETPLKTIEDLLVEHNIGRLPVVSGNKLLGIVTRSDIIATFFGENSPRWYKKNYLDSQNLVHKNQNLSDKINALPKRVKNLLIEAGKIADDEGLNAYVVGGFVRDLILGEENFDIDIVVEGDALRFSEKLANHYQAQLTKHDRFGTAVVVLEDDFKIDVVTARKEYYEYPASLPVVEGGTIKDDLFRRDFTINSMAIKLNKSGFGNIVDFYGGRKDLQMGLIRILYNLSFVEDPTRIFRAIRFEQRYDFKMEEKTEEFAIKAIESGILGKVSLERINFEFFAMLKESNILAILERMENLRIFKMVYPEIKLTDGLKKLLKNAEEDLAYFREKLKSQEAIDRTLLYLLILYSDMSFENASKLSENMRLSKEYKSEILKLIEVKDRVLSNLSGNIDMSNYHVYNELKGVSVEILLVLCMLSREKKLIARIILYINSLKDIKTQVTGKDLKQLGIEPGPEYALLLEKVLAEKLNGNLQTYNDELAFLKKIINEEKK
ncbi:MAG TPA: CBS domain-containing protein [Acetivibrio sp.]|uniref:CBS domain-containing protein n=1 Tax=Acetivibrio sp. TaxID=1872092 RepID=UPI002BEFBB40|nr:CBS domain-containing protein [Acetivibrio sp.]HOM02540.1 CBS domain-containing protein [Acetivibrio sp.]